MKPIGQIVTARRESACQKPPALTGALAPAAPPPKAVMSAPTRLKRPMLATLMQMPLTPRKLEKYRGACAAASDRSVGYSADHTSAATG